MTSTSTRNTWQREAIRELLSQADEFRSAAQLHAELTQQGRRIGLATVYRTLQLLVDSGEIDMVRSEDGEACYRKCSARHHHHLTCLSCGVTVEVVAEAVEKWAAKVAAEHGFTAVTHNLELRGTCSACSNAK